MIEPASADALRRRIAELESRLVESEETLDAIRSGEVDAVVVGEADQRRVFTLESADRPYRLLVEEMREGAVTLSADGLVLYCNHAFANMIGIPASQVVGARFSQFLTESREPLDQMFEAGGRTEIVLRSAAGTRNSASFSLSPLNTDDGRLLCGVIADLTESRDLADARQDLAVAVARQESEERYRALFEAIDAGFCVIDIIFDEHGKATDYRFVETNPAFEQQSGLADAVGRRIREFAPDLEDIWFERYGRVALTGESFRVEEEAASLGKWFDINAFRTGAPGQDRVAVLVNDMTARRTAEEHLRQLNANLERQVIERTHELGRTWSITPDMLSIIDVATGIFDRVNPAWTATLGWSADKLEGAVFADFVHPDDLAASYEGLAVLKRGDPLLFFENRYRNRAGAYRWLRWVAVPEDGKLYSTTRDVTDEKAQAAELAARTAERDQMWLLSRDIMLRCGFDGAIMAVNPAWTEVLGWQERELVGRILFELIHPDDLRHTQEGARAHAEGRSYERFENRYRHKDGGYRWISWSTRADADAIVAVGRDITEDKAREEALRQAEEALRQSQKMEAMGQLTGGVAHDFNNLLTPIIGSLDMLQRHQIGSEREQRLINGALQSADRAKTLVQRLLAFARRQPLKASAVDLGVLLDGMGELVLSTSGPQINIVVNAPKSLAPAFADANQLEMAILNLAVNARDAMPDGGTLTLTARDVEIGEGHRSALPPGAYVGLSVADTGTGMDSATMKRAVEPFFSTKGIGKGTGLGLSMVHGLASQLGGAMTLASEPGLGTKVELWLPVSSRPAEASPESDAPAPNTAGAGRVLLVDDEAIVRTSTADMLSDLGYEVIEASSAGEALKLLDSGLKADLLLTDHLMPGMTGCELAREARARWPDCPVLLISGFAEAEGIAPDLPRLTKPFRQAELAGVLASLR